MLQTSPVIFFLEMPVDCALGPPRFDPFGSPLSLRAGKASASLSSLQFLPSIISLTRPPPDSLLAPPLLLFFSPPPLAYRSFSEPSGSQFFSLKPLPRGFGLWGRGRNSGLARFL